MLAASSQSRLLISSCFLTQGATWGAGAGAHIHVAKHAKHTRVELHLSSRRTGRIRHRVNESERASDSGEDAVRLEGVLA